MARKGNPKGWKVTRKIAMIDQPKLCHRAVSLNDPDPMKSDTPKLTTSTLRRMIGTTKTRDGQRKIVTSSNESLLGVTTNDPTEMSGSFVTRTQDTSEFKCRNREEEVDLIAAVLLEECLMVEEAVVDHLSRDIAWIDHLLTEAEVKRDHDSKDGTTGHSTIDLVDLNP